MSDVTPLSAERRGLLTQAQLYGGSFTDGEALFLHSFDTPGGQVALALKRGPGKTGPTEDAAALLPLPNGGIVLLVADGVGGLPTGWKASGMVVASLESQLNGVDDEDNHVRTAILDGIENANSSLLQLATGTATTLVVAEIRAGSMRTFHIGDSAAWVCGQRGVVKLQTTPHSPVGFALEAGLMNEAEALGHDELNVISNVVGSADMRIEIGPRLQLAARDTVLLASDGLFDNLLESEIINIIRTGSLSDNIVQLLQLAERRMAGVEADKPCKPDDFTAILFRPSPPSSG
ncbi:MAG: protein phosphatase 2C domain-containing protein [Gammaproteobacteria bacterium]|jgi:serine/threonine protein phosphatase PrpC|nr:protein phosphatase 2C domain-containing protein [Gammaproteobacteria bacterium]